jgi:hypothetical protein
VRVEVTDAHSNALGRGFLEVTSEQPIKLRNDRRLLW